MLRRLFGSGRIAHPSVTEALYSEIVAAARQQTFYSAWDVPDTPLGRFEMLSLHLFLFLHRIRGDEATREIGQRITDEFFLDVDHSLRELGIGDMGVPKRVKKLGRMFYGRLTSYSEAVDQDDRRLLAAALARNIMPAAPNWPHGEAMAAYVFAARDLLASQPSSSFLGGAVRFPSPAFAGPVETPA